MWASKESALSLVRNHKFQLVSTAVLSATAGAAAGISVYAKKLEMKYEAISAQEIKEARDYYTRVFDKPPLESLVGVEEGEPVGPQVLTEGDVVEAVEALSHYRGDPPDPEMVDKITEVIQNPGQQSRDVNIFDPNVSSIDLPEHLKDERSADKPYLISEEEFLLNEPEHVQDSFTYYDGDDVLADRNDQIVADVEGLVGADNLMRWGYGSNDENMIYVRIEARDLDIEVARHDGTYAKAVHDIDPDESDHLAHSDYRVRKMRRNME